MTKEKQTYQTPASIWKLSYIDHEIPFAKYFLLRKKQYILQLIFNGSFGFHYKISFEFCQSLRKILH